jgi:hypothetical protein
MAVVWALRSRVALLNMPYLGIMESDTNLKYLQRIFNFDQVATRSIYMKYIKPLEMTYKCNKALQNRAVNTVGRSAALQLESLASLDRVFRAFGVRNPIVGL